MLRHAKCYEPRWTRQSLNVILLCTLLLRIAPFVCAAPALGRATFYGNGDGFTLNDGSCACHKRWGWLSNRCESGHCFDYIGQPSPAQYVCNAPQAYIQQHFVANRATNAP